MLIRKSKKRAGALIADAIVAIIIVAFVMIPALGVIAYSYSSTTGSVKVTHDMNKLYDGFADNIFYEGGGFFKSKDSKVVSFDGFYPSTVAAKLLYTERVISPDNRNVTVKLYVISSRDP